MKYPTTALIIIASLSNHFTHSFTVAGRSPLKSPSFFTTAPSSTSSRLFSTDVDDINSMELPAFSSLEEYTSYLSARSSLPEGFACGSAAGTFISVEAPALGPLPIKATVVYLPDGPSDSWTACFTKNMFPGAPIKVGRARLSSNAPLQALVINNKVSNVCSGGDGVAASELVCASVASALDLENGASSVLPSSTGVIGWNLPAKELAEDVVPKAVANMQSDSVLDAAVAIMTTDRFPKVRSWTLANGARIVGIAKGAGMIEPNMATMLAYVFTDAVISKETLTNLLPTIVDGSFNSISVDGDESTSDTVVAISSNKVDGTDLDEFEHGFREVCVALAADIVRNGEGTSHVLRVEVQNFPGSDADARRLGKHVVDSPLFKCAVSGNDPNTGRLAGAIGSFMGKMDGLVDSENATSKMTLSLGGRIIFANSKFILEGGDVVEKELSDHMKEAQFGELDDFPVHQKFVEVGIDFGNVEGAAGSATVLGSDLTKEYVTVNADYRS